MPYQLYHNTNIYILHPIHNQMYLESVTFKKVPVNTISLIKAIPSV